SSDFGRRKRHTEKVWCKTFTEPNVIIRLHENIKKERYFMKFPGGMDMQSMMRQAQQMQEQMGREMKEMVVEASAGGGAVSVKMRGDRSEEHTSELQSRENLVCRLLLEKKNKV